ncbi:DUF1934 domain-containing protein [Aneurinibacillus sp. BA2021]|nr:DUF1934 domain-containing protein [Aneurinibacillus sp. BA2021]
MDTFPVQEVNIEVVSEFSLAMAPSETNRITYQGQLHFMNGTWYIKYVEQDEDGRTNATVKVKEDEIVVIRSGMISMRQSYRPGVKTGGVYHSAAGAMQMDTDTKDIALRYDADGYLHTAVWVYDLHLNEQNIGQYTVQCRLTRA